MNINRNNYETYLIDYLDGRLDAVEVSELLLFIEQHPQIKEEFENFTELSVAKEEEISFDKSALKKPVYSEIKKEYEHLLVAKLEGDLSLAEYTKLEKAFHRYPELKQDQALFAKTKIQPEYNEIFANKNQLKKKETGVFRYSAVLLRIAAVMLLFGFGTWIFVTLNGENKQTAVLPGIQKKNSKNVPQQVRVSPDLKRMPSPSIAQAAKHIGKEHEELIVEPEHSTKPQVEVIALQGLQTAAIANDIQTSEIGIVLQKTETVLSYPQQQVAPAVQEYPTLKQLALMRLEKQKEQMLGKNIDGKTRTFIQAINKYTGANLKVEKDSSGKVRGFEIAGIGLGWGQSK